MNFLNGFREALDTSPYWLEVRDDLSYELQILDVLGRRPDGLERPLDQTMTLGQLRAALSVEVAQIERSRARRIIAAGHDLRLRVGRAATALLRVLIDRFHLALRPRVGAPARPVAAVVHIFYPDLAAEIRRYLESIPGPVDLFISTDAEAKREAIMATFRGWPAGAVDVRIAPNRGRDIAPKLITFRDVYDRYEYVLHLHSKKSGHASHLRLWRHFVYETLLGAPGVVAAILAAFERDPRLGIVAPEHFRPMRPALSWGDNRDLAEGLAARMDVTLARDRLPDFPAGSMFWARSAALRPLLYLDLRADDFPQEAGQADGTLAHAIERLYFVACAKAGFGWIKIARAEFAHARTSFLVGETGLGAACLTRGPPRMLILVADDAPKAPPI